MALEHTLESLDAAHRLLSMIGALAGADRLSAVASLLQAFRAAAPRDPHWVCEGVDAWAEVLGEKDTGFRHAYRQVRGSMVKSSLLRRLLYEGEHVRTEKCPVHEGRWHGIGTPGKGCECGPVRQVIGSNTPDDVFCEMTGWKPDPRDLESTAAALPVVIGRWAPGDSAKAGG